MAPSLRYCLFRACGTGVMRCYAAPFGYRQKQQIDGLACRPGDCGPDMSQHKKVTHERESR
jgi:hypothetical protein